MGSTGRREQTQGLFRVDEYYSDAVVMELKSGGKWKELGDMWEEGERRRQGKFLVEGQGEDVLGIFMLDRSEIFRYNVICYHGLRRLESTVPKIASDDSSVGFVALNGELHLLTLLNINDSTTDGRRFCQHKRPATLVIQIYRPVVRAWRSFIVRPPFPPLDFKTAVMYAIRLLNVLIPISS